MAEDNVKKNKQAIITIIAVIAIPLIFYFVPKLFQGHEEKKSLENWIQAPAVIMDLKDTGNRYHMDLEVTVFLLIKPEGRDEFKADVTRVLSAVDIMKFQPGKTVQVKYDPENITDVALVPGTVPQ